MKTAKIIVSTILVVLFLLVQNASAQLNCNGKEYPDWVFLYPASGQQGKPLMVSESALTNSLNLKDQRSKVLVVRNLDSILAAHEGKQYAQFWIYANSEGETCVRAVAGSDSQNRQMQSASTSSQPAEPKTSLFKRVLGFSAGSAPELLHMAGVIDGKVAIPMFLAGMLLEDRVNRPPKAQPTFIPASSASAPQLQLRRRVSEQEPTTQMQLLLLEQYMNRN